MMCNYNTASINITYEFCKGVQSKVGLVWQHRFQFVCHLPYFRSFTAI